MRDYSSTVKNLREAAKGLLFDAMPYRASVMRDAADAIEELVAAVPKWISVEDRLPDVAEKVITYNGNYVSDNWLCTITDKDGKREIWAYSEGFVTHWMPLPDPPKEVV